jgi:uncharacterized protein
MNADGTVSDGTGDAGPSFFHEYKLKHEKLSGKFYTGKGRELARRREAASAAFYGNMLAEVRGCYENGGELLAGALT